MARDYAQYYVPYLTSQFTESPKLNALMSAILDPLTLIEQNAESMTTERWIATAIGAQLDGCGYIVGEARSGRNDEDYRAAILFRVFVNTSDATPKDLLKGLRYLTKSDSTQYLESYPATAIVWCDGFNVSTKTPREIDDLAPSAISNIPVVVSYGLKTPFRFSKIGSPGVLFANGSYLNANSSHIKLTLDQTTNTESTLGGVALPTLKTNNSRFVVSGGYLAINSPDHTIAYGGDALSGVFQ